MERTYYYFVASLPFLSMGGPMPMTIDEFMQQCESLLAPEDYACVRMGVTASDCQTLLHNETFCAWMAFERSLRNEIAWERCERAHKDPSLHVRGERYPEPWLEAAVDQAMRAETPLEAELIVDRTRWQFLEDLTVGHYFDMACVLVYGIKLKILERYHTLRSSEGKNIFEQLAAIGEGVAEHDRR